LKDAERGYLSRSAAFIYAVCCKTRKNSLIHTKELPLTNKLLSQYVRNDGFIQQSAYQRETRDRVPWIFLQSLARYALGEKLLIEQSIRKWANGKELKMHAKHSGVLILLVFWISCLPMQSVSADHGPKPTLDFAFTQEFPGPQVNIVSGTLLECQQADCSDAHPLPEMGPQRFSCEVTSCRAILRIPRIPPA
jgi:hypothetical protein